MLLFFHYGASLPRISEKERYYYFKRYDVALMLISPYYFFDYATLCLLSRRFDAAMMLIRYATF